MADQFSLTADPESLKSAEKLLGDIGTQLEEEGAKLAALPGQHAVLSGGTAEVLKKAMTLLAGDMRAGSPHIGDAVRALAAFREAVQAAKDILPSLNSQWAQAESDRDAAVARADKSYTDAKAGLPSGVWHAEERDMSATRASAKSQAQSTMAESQRWIGVSWNAYTRTMSEKAVALNAVLTNAVSRAVSPQVVKAGGYGGLPAGYGFDATSYLKGTSPFPSPVSQTMTHLVTIGVLPPETAGMDAQQLTAYLKDHPDVARQLAQNAPQPGSTDPAERGLALLFGPMITNAGADVGAIRRDGARTFFEQYSAEDQKLLAVLFPSQVGNLSGAPFAARAAANRISIFVANDDLARGIAQLQEKMKDADGLEKEVLQKLVDQLGEVQATYQSVIDDGNRQIVMFDASKGAMAELTGDIDAGTTNVGVLVPGTGARPGTFNGDVDRSSTFVDASGGSLAMVTWLGGQMPQSVIKDSPWASYSRTLAPSLAEFSHDVRQEIEHSQAAGAQLTLAGHSYGGAIVGLAETKGADADRVLHIESAGMGNDVDDPGDLHPTNPNVKRYSMTAPGDPIGDIQGLELGSLGHGADPDTFPDTTRLETGYYADHKTLIEGGDAHGGVFKLHSDAWDQMYQVFTGGVITTYGAHEPPQIYIADPTGYGPGMYVDNPAYAPPTQKDIP